MDDLSDDEHALSSQEPYKMLEVKQSKLVKNQQKI